MRSQAEVDAMLAALPADAKKEVEKVDWYAVPVTLENLDKMPGDVQRNRLMSEPKFREEVNKLYERKPAAAPAPAPAEELEQDPTGMVARSAVPAPASVAPVPVPVPAPVPVPPVKQRYTYQPTDDNGRSLGGLQVIEYTTAEELRDELVKRNNLILRQLRKVTREKELGAEPQADDAEKFQNVTTFKQRELTADERFNLSQKIASPETANEAIDVIIEAAFGAKPAVLVETLNETQQFMIQQRAVDNYVEFVSRTPGYYDCPANRAAITGYMGVKKRNWAPTLVNFQKAYSEMVNQVGLLESAPEVHQVPPAPAAPVEPPAPPVAPVVNPQPPAVTNPGLGSEPPQSKRHSHVPSGLNSTVASASGEMPADEMGMTLADLEKMPADVYRRRLSTDPKFREIANRLYEEQEKRSRAKRLGQV